MGQAIPADKRPFDYSPVTLNDLPDTPTRDRNIAAAAWDAAPTELLQLGADIEGKPEPYFKRRIFGWLVWLAGPSRGPGRYMAMNPSDHSEFYFFDLGDGETTGGKGPDGEWHSSFRAWKESLRDDPRR